MHLRDYLRESGQSQKAFGQQLVPTVSVGKLNKWLSGRLRVSLREALQVNRLTDGRVTLEELAAMYRPVDGDEDSGSEAQHGATVAVAPPAANPNAGEVFA